MPAFGCMSSSLDKKQFGLAQRWIEFPKGRECAARSNFGQPKAEFNPLLYKHIAFIHLIVLN